MSSIVPRSARLRPPQRYPTVSKSPGIPPRPLLQPLHEIRASMDAPYRLENLDDAIAREPRLLTRHDRGAEPVDARQNAVVQLLRPSATLL